MHVNLCFRLQAAAKACLKIQLLSYLERGSLYLQIKERAYPGDWEKICREELGVAPYTVSRYIDFYELVGVYPRIIICELSFETIMFCKREIINMLKEDTDLAVRFAKPLPEINIMANMSFGEECLPTNDSDMATTGKKTRDWNAGWEISDEILDITA